MEPLCDRRIVSIVCSGILNSSAVCVLTHDTSFFFISLVSGLSSQAVYCVLSYTLITCSKGY